MSVNGSAIYGSRVWKTSAEGPTRVKEGHFSEETIAYTSEDMRFTVTGGSINVFVLRYPEDGRLLIRSLAGPGDHNKAAFSGIISGVSIPGFDEIPSWKQTHEGLLVETRSVKSDLPVVVRVEVK